jgi:uncharacterized membrane protein
LKRYPFLDWMRGLALILMIQCHAFNSFVRPDLRDGGIYRASQFIGGMAAPLFLFMAGMTTGFRIESVMRGLKRAAYIFAIAAALRIASYLASLPHVSITELTKVDILNGMAAAMALFAAVALFKPSHRAPIAAAAALIIAIGTPVVANLDWSGVPPVVRDYVVPSGAAGQFSVFPFASYLGFGLAAGILLKRAEALAPLMRGAAVVGVTALAIAPSVLARTGAILIIMLVIYLWTQSAASQGWSWVQCIGRHSLLIYCVHLPLIYGLPAAPFRSRLTIALTAIATVVIAGLMVGLSAARDRSRAS